ncbi:MAG: EscU/YscU/HrcU family type III secretion system export apparatus switch protein [Succinivibrio sp.]
MEDKDQNQESGQEILEPDAEYLSKPPFDDDGAEDGWNADAFAKGDDDDQNGRSGASAKPNDDAPEGGEDAAGETGGDQHAPTQAASISYDEGSPAPVLSAIGSGERADAIIAMAKELGVYIHRDERLLSELKRLREGEEIPKELYAVIAAVLSFSYLLQGRTPSSYKRQDGTTAINTKA